MLNKKLLSAAITTAVLAGAGATQAVASEAVEVSGNVTLTTDYRFRGISQSNTDPAIQGGFDVNFAPGFYVGTWGSSVDFGGGEYGSLELDYYAGWAGSIGDSGVGIDVGYIYYDYPGDDSDVEGDYQEVYASVSWMDVELGVAYSDDYYAESDDFWYVQADYSFTLLEELTIGLHAGYNMLEEGGGFFADDEDSYFDYSVSATYSWSDVDFTLALVGTDIDDTSYDDDLTDDTAVFSISKSL